MSATRLYPISGSGDVGPASGGTLGTVILTGGSDAATLTLRHGGSGGGIIAVFKTSAANVTESWACNLGYDGQLHATFAGTGPVATIGL